MSTPYPPRLPTRVRGERGCTFFGWDDDIVMSVGNEQPKPPLVFPSETSLATRRSVHLPSSASSLPTPRPGWPQFLWRLKNLIAAKGNIQDGHKKGILLDALDDQTLDRLDRWLEPVLVDATDYNTVLTTLEENMAEAGRGST